MAKIKSNMVNMVGVLTLITALVGAILGGVYTMTKGPIALTQAKAQENALRMVAPHFDNDPIAESREVQVGNDTFIIYPATYRGVAVGGAVRAVSHNGFNGDIVVIVGFEKDGTIREYQVLSHGETPGLGAKMDEWFRTESKSQNIIGCNPATTDLTVSKDGGDIDAITASTITSRAFLECIVMAYQAYMETHDTGLEDAIRAVAPAHDNNPLAHSQAVIIDNDTLTVYHTLQGDTPTGAVVHSVSHNGFNGDIEVVVGFDNEGTIHDYQVIKHNETPGLGSEMEYWFRSDNSRSDIRRKHPEKNNLTINLDGGEIDAITASTITSRAFLESIATAYKAYCATTHNTQAATHPEEEVEL